MPQAHTKNTTIMTTRDNGLADQNDSRMTHAIETLAKHPPFVVNRQQKKQVAKYLMKEFEQGAEYRHQALRMALETRLQSMEEYCNHTLVTGKAEYRRERNSFFAEQLSALQKKMDELADEFSTNVDERLTQLERYTSKHLKERERARLEKSIDDFMDTLDLLMDDYKSIAQSKIAHQPI